MATKKRTETTLYVATVIDERDGIHIAAGRDVFAGLCGTIGTRQHFNKDCKVSELCPRCVERHMRALVSQRLTEKGL